MGSKPRRRQYGEGSISSYTLRTGETRYRIKVHVIGRDGAALEINRRRSLAGKPFKTRKEAAAGIREILAKADSPDGFNEPSKMLTRDYLLMWLDELRLTPGTVAYYRRLMRLHVIPYIGGVPLAKLNASHINAMYRTLETSGSKRTLGTPSSPQMIRKVHTGIRKALRDAVRNDYLDVNPTDKATPPPASAARPPEMKYWTEAQVRQFLGWCSKHWSNPMHVQVFRLAFATGARRGELMALRWSDVDFETSRISIRRSVGTSRQFGSSMQLVEGATKTGKNRPVDIDPETLAMLRNLKRDRGLLAFELSTHEAIVFGDSEGMHTPPDSVSWAFKEAQKVYRDWLVEQAKGEDQASAVELLPVIRFHDIRHTHATILLSKGVHPRVTQERLGHSEITTTMNTYSHVMPSMQKEAAEVIAKALSGA